MVSWMESGFFHSCDLLSVPFDIDLAAILLSHESPHAEKKNQQKNLSQGFIRRKGIWKIRFLIASKELQLCCVVLGHSLYVLNFAQINLKYARRAKTTRIVKVELYERINE